MNIFTINEYLLIISTQLRYTIILLIFYSYVRFDDYIESIGRNQRYWISIFLENVTFANQQNWIDLSKEIEFEWIL